MSMIIMLGLPVLFFGVPILVVVAIMGITELVKRIRHNYKVNKAIEELGDEAPEDILFNKDSIYETADKSHFQEIIAREEAEYKKLSFFGKIKHFFSEEKKESVRHIKDIYKEKKEAIKTERYDDDLGQLERELSKQELSRAKSAYRILKSENGRAKYREALNKKPPTLASSAEAGSNSNTAHKKRTGEITFKINTTPLQKFMMLFKSGSKQYTPSQLSARHMNTAQLHNQG